MTLADAVNRNLVEVPTSGCSGPIAVGKYSDIYLQFGERDGQQILRGVLVKTAAYETREGVSVGDPISIAMKFYPRMTSKTGEYGETVGVMTAGTKAIGFTHSDGKIEAIDVFATGQPVVWDGC